MRERIKLQGEKVQRQDIKIFKAAQKNASKFGNLSSGHRTGEGQFSFQSQRKVMPKNAQTTAQLHSSHMLIT